MARHSWSTITSATTASTGAYAFAVKPSSSTRYRVGYLGSTPVGGAYSGTAAVGVAPVVAIVASTTSLRYGGYVTFSTTVRPSHVGASIVLQRWTGTTWVTAATRTLTSSSTASARVKPPSRGTIKYRWLLPAHTDHSVAVSGTVSVRVS